MSEKIDYRNTLYLIQIYKGSVRSGTKKETFRR